MFDKINAEVINNCLISVVSVINQDLSLDKVLITFSIDVIFNIVCFLNVWLLTIEFHLLLQRQDCSKAALKELYVCTRGMHWYRQINWMSTAPIRDWEEVCVDTTGQVSALWLYRNNLCGIFFKIIFCNYYFLKEISQLAYLNWEACRIYISKGTISQVNHNSILLKKQT
jgi:hypothetical protein